MFSNALEHTTDLFQKIEVLVVYAKCFFLLLIHFLVVEDHELPESRSHYLSVTLNPECTRILP